MPPRPAPWTQGRKYGVVIDAGSSGSRIQVYSWIDPEIARHDRKVQGKPLDVLSRVEKGVEDGDGWHSKVEPGISTYGDNPEGVAEYLRPLVEHAASIIPAEELPSTPIYLLATAGMRLLPHDKQVAVLSATCSYLRTFPFQLPDCDDQVRIISGEEEGLYGWIAVNYLMDGFDKHEHAVAGERSKHSSTYGFLDMGGASTQIAFEPSDTEQVKHADNLLEVRLRLLSGKDVRHPVFVTTWLGFGTNQARNRYVDQEVKKHVRESDKEHLPGDGAGLGSEHPVVLVDDPCLPRDLMLSEARHAGYTLRGTGDFAQCLRRQAPLLNKEVDCPDEPCLFNGVHVPPIDFTVNHFIGISEYWYSTQDVWGAALANAPGGVYDYVAFERAAIEYCGRTWDDIMRDYQAGQGSWKAGVELSRLETQCFKAAWIVNILHEGIGIPRIIDRGGRGDGKNQTEKGVAKAIDKNLVDEPPSFQSMNEVNNVAISWTLGKMVLEVAKGSTELPSAAVPHPSTSYRTPYGAFRMGDWSGHIPSWRGDVRTTIAAVKDSPAVPFVGFFAVVVALWLFLLSPSSARRRKSFCGPFAGRTSPRRSDFALLPDDGLGLSGGDQTGNRTPPRGGRRKPGNPLAARLLSPLQRGTIRLSSLVRSLRSGAPLSRSTSAGSLLPMSRAAVKPDDSGDIFRPRPLRPSKSNPFLRSATVTANIPSASGYWNDAPDAPPLSTHSASRQNTASYAAASALPRSPSGPLVPLPRTSSPPPMAIIPPSPLSRPTTPSSALSQRPQLTRLTSRTPTREYSLDDAVHIGSGGPYSTTATAPSGRTSPAPLSAPAREFSGGLSGAVWDSLGPSGLISRDDDVSPTPGVGASGGAGAKLRASRSANNSQVNLAAQAGGGSGGGIGGGGGGGGYFGSAGSGSARRPGGPVPLSMLASASSTSLGGGSSVGTPGGGE
ncbi:apyrase [Rhodotorula paludigena]|uniref:apyrase n=1 Tax=Rhodotorula paludigena TaxID=86838 RepID=UPI0031827652